MAEKGKKTGTVLYFLLLFLLLFMLLLHTFGFYPLQTDFSTRYLIALIVVVMLLPLIPKIKIFDIIDVKRETRMFKSNKK